MAFTHSITRAVATAGRNVSKIKAYSGESQLSINVSIPDAASDLLVNFTLDVSVLQSIYIHSDQDVTLETNDGAAPTDTINLKAGVPYIWAIGDYFTNKITADITALYFTNASGSAAVVDIEALTDPTP